MRVLVVGGGGREHAIVKTLKKSPGVEKLYCAPGNAGTAADCENVPIAATDIVALCEYVKDEGIDYTVVGMDDPLAAGIVDLFLSEGLKIFGPIKAAARIEWSKDYSKRVMKKYGIPTARYESFSDFDSALAYARGKAFPLWVKADGLAVGKGAIGCKDVSELEAVLKLMLVERALGRAGETVVIEENLIGEEFTVLAFCDGETLKPMVSSQDYKRALDGGKGLNTGGMGAVSPALIYTPEIKKECYEKIFVPTLEMLKSEGIDYRGVIYFGLIATESGVKVIEYNSRFGDPETQAILPRLKTDLLEIFMACSEGRLHEVGIEWEENYSCCVCAVSGGYPERYEKGFPIIGADKMPEGVICFHAGTSMKNGQLVTNGGRVLGLTGLGKTENEARSRAYGALTAISFEKMRFRSDIGLSK